MTRQPTRAPKLYAVEIRTEDNRKILFGAYKSKRAARQGFKLAEKHPDARFIYLSVYERIQRP